MVFLDGHGLSLPAAVHLTERQREIYQALLAGLSNKQIGRHFDISYRTAEIHRANLMDRMKASSFAEVVRLGVLGDVSPLAHEDLPDGE